ncbi:MAG: DinB family protein [Firmicutes bacterium]|nr:DinB family protein [Bacillota bacterium]
MAIRDALLPEFDFEMDKARKTLERVPEGRFDWRPHPKSPTMGWLAGHVAQLPFWAVITIQQDRLDLAPPGAPSYPAPEPGSRKELLETFDKNVAAARAAIASASDDHLHQNWTLLKGGQELMTLPRAAVLRSFVLNHLIHHRAQLGVYLRLNDVPVPSIYGPSADEQPF